MKIVSGFYHTTGNHCGSTAVRDLLHCVGLDLSEAMCFGLGSGLGFVYFRDVPETGISHFFHGRLATLERDLCQHLRLDFQEGQHDQATEAWQVARAFIDADLPLMLNVELSRIPYYKSRTPFPGHRVVLAGYDDARQVAFLADNAFEHLQEIAFDDLRDARFAPVPSTIFPLRNDWLVVKSAMHVAPIADAIVVALRENALEMIGDRSPYRGVAGMRTLAEDFVNWGNASDWEFCARFGYQIIERRGTGGGAFRKMYAEYLAQAIGVPTHLANAMREIADAWTMLAMQLKRVSEEKNRALFKESSQVIERIATLEEQFWGRVLDFTGE